MPSLVLGTAGHIDHGKSSLIKALTGTDPDRLKEERDRGITIELGFARLELPSGRTMGVVDVPGHEKFVRHMVAGATGIDVVLFVVAADDGVMPQTREHLAIVDLLGVERGVVALTKSDLAEPGWIDLVRSDVERLLAGTSIEGAPIVTVSAKTGEGLPELLAAIDGVADATKSRHADAPMRLPVDRVFTIAGAGTVVTGTMWSGSAAKDDQVEIHPGGIEARVRGVQVHGEAVQRAHAGQRVAMNLAGVERDEINRGDVVAAPGVLRDVDRFDARVTYLGVPGEDRPFESGARVHVDHGTREVIGRVLLMDDQARLHPGEQAFAQVRLEEPLAPRYGDRFILRSYSPVYTIGGGTVLDADPPRRTMLSAGERELLEALLARDIDAATVLLVAGRRAPMTSADAASVLGIPRAEAAAALDRSGLERLKVGSETAYSTAEALDGAVEAIERELLAFHEADPSAVGIPVIALRDRVDRALAPKAFDALLAIAVKRGAVRSERGLVSHPRAAGAALALEREARDRLLELLREQALAPAGVRDLATAAGIDPGVARKALSALVEAGEAVRVSSEMFVAAEAMESARGALTAALRTNPDGLTAAELRDALGVSRKYAIPLLEYFDAQGVTRRDGDVRTLR